MEDGKTSVSETGMGMGMGMVIGFVVVFWRKEINTFFLSLAGSRGWSDDESRDAGGHGVSTGTFHSLIGSFLGDLRHSGAI